MGQDLVKINRIASSENVIQFLQSLQPSEKLPQKRERNLKQKALLNKYPDPAQFILDYNPDLQFKLVRCNATHSELASNDSIPSLGLLSSTYGDETPIEWLKIQFGSLNDFAEVSTKIAKNNSLNYRRYFFRSITTSIQLRFAFLLHDSRLASMEDFTEQ
ncbi:hypothetical protein ACIXR2_23265 [Bacteroides fragilis]